MVARLKRGCTVRRGRLTVMLLTLALGFSPYEAPTRNTYIMTLLASHPHSRRD